jgi:hypothetical protein
MGWTNDDWSQRHIDKAKLASKLESKGMIVLGWCNRKPDLTREDGQPVDWGEVESVAEKLFLSRKPPKPVEEKEPKKTEEEKPKPVKKPVKRSRKRTTKKK